MSRDRCFFLKKGPPCFIQLGRYGDLIILFPAFQEIFRRTGHRPVVIVAEEYASVFEGISYAKPWVIRAGWWEGVPKARAMAQEDHGHVIVPQFWNDPGNHDDLSDKAFRGGVVLQCHGIGWGVNMALWPNFMTSMWDRAGFTREEMLSLPLVFDQRRPDREQQLAQRTLQRGKPAVLYNFTGISSPFPFAPEILNVMRPYRDRFQLVDLGKVRAHRIYDLLGLYDRAVGAINSDTATLHLCATGKIPHVAFTIDGWRGSDARGDVRFSIPYSQAREQAWKVAHFLDSLKAEPEPQLVPAGDRGGNRL